LSNDKFNSNYKDIYQVNISESFYTAAPLATLMKEKMPEMRSVARIDYYAGGGQSSYMEVEEKSGSLKK